MSKKLKNAVSVFLVCFISMLTLSASAENISYKMFSVQKVPFESVENPVKASFDVSKEVSCWRVWVKNDGVNDIEFGICDQYGELISSQTVVGKSQSILQGVYDGSEDKATYQIVLLNKDKKSINGLYAWRTATNFAIMDNINNIQNANQSYVNNNEFFVSGSQYLNIDIPSTNKYMKVSVKCDSGNYIKAKITDKQGNIISGGDVTTISKGSEYIFNITCNDNSGYILSIKGVDSYSASGLYNIIQTDKL